MVVSFTCDDTGSGIASCSPPVTLDGHDAHQTVTVTAVDRACNSRSITTSPINIDLVAPDIGHTLTPPASGGWNNTDVFGTFTCADDLSLIAACSGPITVATEGQNQAVTGTAIDKTGNVKSDSATVSIDKTAPVLGTPS